MQYRNVQQNNRMITQVFLGVIVLFFGMFAFDVAPAHAQSFNQEINYQAKLTDNTGATVADGTYNVEFKLYTQESGGVAIWTETASTTVTNGLFSYMLGSSSSLAGVDFNDTLYLGVNIGGTGSPTWDGEMSPRKVLGAVPAAFEAKNAQTFAGIATTSFLRSNIADTMTALLTFANGFISQSSSTIEEITTGTTTVTTFSIDGESYTSVSGGTSGLTNNSGVLTANISESHLNIAAAPTDDYVLTASSTAAGGFAWDLINPDSVQPGGQVDEYCLTYEAGDTWQWQDCSGGAINLGDLGDVNTTNIAAGGLLSYTGAFWATTSTSSLKINTSDLVEGSNQFWTNARFDQRLAGTSTLPGLTTLANLTSIQGLTTTLADAGANAFFGWDDTAGAYENLSAAEALAIIGGQANDFDANGDVTITEADISDFAISTGDITDSTITEADLDLNAAVNGYILAASSTASGGMAWYATSSAYLNLAALDTDTTLTAGTDNQIPFTNAGGTDFDYSANFTFDGINFLANATTSIGTTTATAARLSVQSAGTHDILNLFEAGGSEVLTVLESGNVGIGTTTPDTLVHIQSSGAAMVDVLKLQNTSASDDWGSAIVFQNSTDAAPSYARIGSTRGPNAAYSDLHFEVESLNTATELLTIKGETLSVGIGTTSPASKLDVWGDFRVGTSSTPSLFVDVSADQTFIGTTTPTTLGDGSFNSPTGLTIADRALMFYNSSSPTRWAGVELDGNGYLHFDTEVLYDFDAAGASRIMRLSGAGATFNANGNAALDFTVLGDTDTHLIFADAGADMVGISTSTPGYTFTVDGDAMLSGRLYDNSYSAGTNGMVLQTTGTGFNWIATSTLGFSESFSNSAELAGLLSDETGTGNVVFSTNPEFEEYIRHAGDTDTYIRFQGDDVRLVVGGDTAFLINEDADPTFNFGTVWDYTFNTDTLFIGGSEGGYAGSVGIGTSSPASKFDVWGDFRVGTSGTPTLMVDAAANQVMIGTDTAYGTSGLYLEDSSTVWRNSSQPSRYTTMTTDSNGYGYFYSTTIADFHVGGITRNMRLSANGVIFNEEGNTAADFRIEGDTDGTLLFVDASSDTVGISTSTASQTFAVDGSTLLWGDFQVGTSSIPTLFADASADQVLMGTTTAYTNGSAIVDTPNLYLEDGGISLRNSSALAQDTVIEVNTLGYLNNFTSAVNDYYVGTYSSAGFVARMLSTGMIINPSGLSDKDFLVYGDTDTELFTVDASADMIGVSTSTPGYTLTVDGDIMATGALYDNNYSAGTNGMVLQTTGTGFAWVATSTLGLGGGGSFSDYGADTQIPYMNGTSDFAYTNNFTFDGSNFTANATTSIGTTTATAARLSIQSTGTNDILNLFETGGSEVLTVLENGNVGIGSDSPATELHVVGDIRHDQGDGDMLEMTTVSTHPALKFTKNGVTPTFHMYYYGGGNFAMSPSANTNPIIIDSSANFGIGDWTTDAHLEVSANGGSGGNIFLLSSDDDNDGDILTVQESGSVGIGTTSPASKLDVYGDFRVGTSSTPSLFVDASADQVLIGTTDATTLGTESQGLFILDDSIVLGHSSEPTRYGEIFTDALGYLNVNANIITEFNIGDPDVTDNLKMQIVSSGVVFNDNGFAGNDLRVEGDTDTHLIFADAGTDMVGVGTSSPASKLDVWGDFRVGTSSATNLYVDTAANQVMIGTTTAYGAHDLYIEQGSIGLRSIGSLERSSSFSQDWLGYLDITTSVLQRNYVDGQQLFSLYHNSGVGNIDLNSSQSDVNTAIYGDTGIALFVDGGTRYVGIGTSSPQALLTVGDGVMSTINGTDDLYVTDDAEIDGSIYVAGASVFDSNLKATAFQGPTDSLIQLRSDANAVVFLDYDNDGSNNFYIREGGGANVFTVDETGKTGVGTTTNLNARLTVQSTGTDDIFNLLETSGTEVFTVLEDGNVGIGTTTPDALLSLENSSISGAGVGGVHQLLSYANSVEDAVQFGNLLYHDMTSNTATTTLVGGMLRVEDGTTYGNLVRGFEVQTDRGANTQGENTALSGFARTFGVRGYSSGDAGGTYEPAGGFFEIDHASQGNAIRGYSALIESQELMVLYQEDSVFTGTGLLMDFGNDTGGSFASTSSKFVDFKNAGTSKFTVSAHGTTTIGDGTTNNMAGLQVGYGGICVDNDGSCNASVLGRMSSVSTFTGNSDLAEMYFSSEDLTPGEIVSADGFISIKRAEKNDVAQVLGVVSSKPGLLLGSDDESLVAGEAAYPLALSGRVPVKLSTENGPIAVGDPLTLSSVPGVAMKAVETTEIVGYALEAFDGTHAYTEGYINQFGDDIAAPDTTPTSQTKGDEAPCRFGAGGAADAEEETCDQSDVPDQTDTTNAEAEAEYEATQEELEALANKAAERATTPAGESVRVGYVTMFVDRGLHLGDQSFTILEELASTSPAFVLGAEEGSGETLWDRLKVLAQGFVDGVLSVTGVKADKVETEELCVEDVCVTADDLRALLEAAKNGGGTVSDAAEDTTDTEEDTAVEDDDVVDDTEEDTTSDATETDPDTADETTDTAEDNASTTEGTVVTDKNTDEETATEETETDTEADTEETVFAEEEQAEENAEEVIAEETAEETTPVDEPSDEEVTESAPKPKEEPEPETEEVPEPEVVEETPEQKSRLEAMLAPDLTPAVNEAIE